MFLGPAKSLGMIRTDHPLIVNSRSLHILFLVLPRFHW